MAPASQSLAPPSKCGQTITICSFSRKITSSLSTTSPVAQNVAVYIRDNVLKRCNQKTCFPHGFACFETHRSRGLVCKLCRSCPGMPVMTLRTSPASRSGFIHSTSSGSGLTIATAVSTNRRSKGWSKSQ